MIEVHLTPFEMVIPCQVAIMRQIQNIKKRRKNAHGTANNDWQLHIEGALGEYAVAKYLGLYWNGSIGNLDAGDVGSYEVRTTANHNNRLLLHPEDKDDSKYILVTGQNGDYIIRGWIYGRDGKQQWYWQDPVGGRPAFFIPQTDLNSMTKENK